MSYDPTEWAPQTPGQPPAQPPVTPSAYGQAPQPPAPPTQGQPAPAQYGAQPPAYGQPPQPGQSNPGFPAYGQPPQQPGQSNPGFPPYGQPPQPGQSNPGFPAYGQPPQQPGQSNPGFPPYGQPSNPALPPYGQPPQAAYGQSSPSYGAPTEQYGQPQQQPWGAAVPPSYIPPAAPRKKSGPKLGIILLIIVVVLVGIGGGGYIVYKDTRPKPVITQLSSKYMDGTTSVGTSSTSLTLKGKDFTASSAITFLLDGTPAPGAPSVQSDSNGNVTATLTVTDAWTVGTHTLTAKDASSYTTNTGVKVEIVTPGQANTPGPNGAPTDSANMSIIAIVVAGSSSNTLNLIVTGSANGGTVCRDIDDGKTHTHTGTSSGVTFTETTVSTCSGTYKGGKLDYTETITTDKAVFDNGLICAATAPYVAAHLQGTFTSGTAVNGNYSDDAVTLSCNLGVGNQPVPANTGTWTGLAVVH